MSSTWSLPFRFSNEHFVRISSQTGDGHKMIDITWRRKGYSVTEYVHDIQFSIPEILFKHDVF